jgi:nitronate monooxygenase
MRPTRRARDFAARFGFAVPILQAPMAGVPAVELAAAVGEGGGMAGMGALLFGPEQIADWVTRLRAARAAPLQINLWVPDPAPRRDAAHETEVRAFLRRFGPEVPASAADAPLRDFAAQCDALLAARPTAVSSIMGLYPEPFVRRLKDAGIAWFANVTTAAEARAAERAGADVIVAQGSEAGGHRGAFDASAARDRAVGLFALLPRVVDSVSVPVVATGGIADARGIAAALLLGASAVQVGTGLLRCPEAGIAPAWAAALDGLDPEGTRLTRAFSGRWGRAVETDYVRAAAAPDAPEPAPYPLQRGFTAPMRKAAEQAGDLQRMQAWSGQAAALARPTPAAELVRGWWEAAQRLLDAA